MKAMIGRGNDNMPTIPPITGANGDPLYSANEIATMFLDPFATFSDQPAVDAFLLTLILSQTPIHHFNELNGVNYTR